MSYQQRSPLAVTAGGTSQITLGNHGVLVGAGTGAIGAIVPGTNGQLLIGATSANPSFITATAGSGLSFSASSSSFQYSLTAPVTVSNGGTGVTSLSTAFAPLIAGATSTAAIGQAATGMSNTGYVLTSTGSGSAPTWQAAAPGGAITSLYGNNTTPITTAASVLISGGTSGGTFTSSTTAVTLSFNYLSLPTTTSTNGQILINSVPVFHTYGTQNLFAGATAGNFTTTGSGGNVALGYASMNSLTSGSNNVAVGYFAAHTLTSGGSCVYIGGDSAATATNESDNVTLGASAGRLMGGATRSVIIGSQAGGLNTFSGNDNTLIGYKAGNALSSGSTNSFGGSFSGSLCTTGQFNACWGYAAGANIVGGGSNQAIGYEALYNNVSGIENIAIGHAAGLSILGDYNICLNNGGSSGDSHTLRIGAGTGTAYQQLNAAYISGIQTIGITGSAVLVSTGDQLGVAVSSRRYKENIEDMQELSSDILRLRPVKFTGKGDDSGRVIGGLIAEEVYDIMPSLVVLDKEGLPQTVMYHEMPAMLLNELQKAIIRIEQLEAKVAYLEDKQWQ